MPPSVNLRKRPAGSWSEKNAHRTKPESASIFRTARVWACNHGGCTYPCPPGSRTRYLHPHHIGLPRPCMFLRQRAVDRQGTTTSARQYQSVEKGDPCPISPRGSATNTLDSDKPEALSLAGRGSSSLTRTFDFHYDFSTMGPRRGDLCTHVPFPESGANGIASFETDTRHAEIYLEQPQGKIRKGADDGDAGRKPYPRLSLGRAKERGSQQSRHRFNAHASPWPRFPGIVISKRHQNVVSRRHLVFRYAEGGVYRLG